MFRFCGGSLCSEKQGQNQIKFQTILPRGGLLQPERQAYSSLEDIEEEVKVDKIVKSKFDKYLERSRISNKQFVDDQFPPNNKSLGNVQLMSGRTVEWRRIGDIIDNPKLLQFIDSKQIVQSNSGDCYFLSSIATLAQNHSRIRSLFGQIQINKSGLYMVRVNVKGVQKQVIIDDYFPVYSHNKQFVYSKPIFNQDIWVMLLEKVWAKINGSYSKIVIGYPHQVLTTFSNAPCFYLKLDSIQDKNSIWQSIKEAKRQNYPVCCSSKNTNLPFGIMQQATYALTNCFEFNVQGMNHRIIALINPWEQNQYNGAYSQKDLNFWNRLGSNSMMLDRQGIVTIGFNDFLNYFESLDISHIHSYYNYNFDLVKIPPNHGKYFSINVKQATQCYFVLQQQRRSKNSQNRQIVFSRMTLVIGKWDNEKKTHYYVDSKMQNYLPTLSARCLVLQPGNYIAYAKCQWLDGSNNQLTFATYSSKRIFIQQTHKNNLIRDVLIDHSLTHGQRTYLDQTSFISFQLLYNQGGYAYLSANPSSSRKILLEFSKKDLLDSGFKLKYPKINDSNIKLIATSTQPQIIICRVLPNAQSLTFPLPIKISQSL